MPASSRPPPGEPPDAAAADENEAQATAVRSVRRRARHPTRLVALAVGVVVAALAVVITLNVGVDPRADASRSHLVGKDAPSFDLPVLGGGRVSLRALTGRSIIVNFWNTWCIPCRQEHPALVEFYRRHATDPDFAMVGIVRDDTKSAVKSYVETENMDWIVAFDPGSRAALEFGTRGQPETYAISPDGVIVASKWGPSRVGDLETMLAAARGGV